MLDTVRTAFRRELELASIAEAEGNPALAWKHLERGHILGQQSFLTHLECHFRMYQLARRQSDRKEARGQLVRLIGAGPFHFAGWIPIGNTGGANVSPTLPMPIPADIRPYFEGFSLRRGLILRGLSLAILVMAYLILRA